MPRPLAMIAHGNDFVARFHTREFLASGDHPHFTYYQSMRPLDMIRISETVAIHPILEEKRMKVGFLSRRGHAPSFPARGLVLYAILLTAFAASAGTSPPLKLAIFDFELEDFSAGASLPAGDPADSEQLKDATHEARRLIAQSGRYTLVNISSSADA
jgi:hypothetical protein